MDLICENNLPLYFISALDKLDIIFKSEGANGIYYASGKGSHKVLLNKLHEPFMYYSQIPGTEFLVDKRWLWINHIKKFQRDKTLKNLPLTWVLDHSPDLHSFKHYFQQRPFHWFILKSNKQKRKGIKLLTGNQLCSASFEDYKVAQPLLSLSKSFTIRPFHLRFYFLLQLNKNQLTGFLLEEAKVLYGESNDLITNNSIESFGEEPDFLSELDNSRQKLIMEEAKSIIKDCIESMRHKMEVGKISETKSFAQLFGVDFILNEEEKLRLLEFNFRPSLLGKFEKDTQLKNHIIHDHFKHFLLNETPATLKWNKFYR